MRKSEVEGQAMKEAQSINKSLAALGDVISALQRKAPHIPFRNSKLTQVHAKCQNSSLNCHQIGGARLGTFLGIGWLGWKCERVKIELPFDWGMVGIPVVVSVIWFADYLGAGHTICILCLLHDWHKPRGMCCTLVGTSTASFIYLLLSAAQAF